MSTRASANLITTPKSNRTHTTTQTLSSHTKHIAHAKVEISLFPFFVSPWKQLPPPAVDKLHHEADHPRQPCRCGHLDGQICPQTHQHVRARPGPILRARPAHRLDAARHVQEVDRVLQVSNNMPSSRSLPLTRCSCCTPGRARCRSST